MYSMPQGNGFCGSPYGNNSNKLLTQQSNQQQNVAAPFKPYKLASPTSSTKHSNLSSGPSTPNTVTGNAIDDVYDMTNSVIMNPSSVPPNSNASAGGPMSHDDMMHMRHDYQVSSMSRAEKCSVSSVILVHKESGSSNRAMPPNVKYYVSFGLIVKSTESSAVGDVANIGFTFSLTQTSLIFHMRRPN